MGRQTPLTEIDELSFKYPVAGPDSHNYRTPTYKRVLTDRRSTVRTLHNKSKGLRIRMVKWFSKKKKNM
jgi:hypothetical protein